MDIFCNANDIIDSMSEEPGAVIVEVEDDGFESLPSNSASSPMKIPIFKFDFACKDLLK
jgi:hypothetical protein